MDSRGYTRPACGPWSAEAWLRTGRTWYSPLVVFSKRTWKLVPGRPASAPNHPRSQAWQLVPRRAGGTDHVHGDLGEHGFVALAVDENGRRAFWDGAAVHILRPSGFEFVGQLQGAVLAAAPKNVKAIRKELAFVEFTAIEEYATTHPRAARYLASILAQDGAKRINRAALKTWCKRTGVEIAEAKGKIIVEKAQVMAFLEVLDRRRYEVELVKGTPERFRAGSRRKLGP
jgi:hypothetical protein